MKLLTNPKRENMKETSAKKLIGNIKTWYDKEVAPNKKKVGVFAIIGDMDKKENYQVMGGGAESIVMALAQAMVTSEEYQAIVREAIDLVNYYYQEENKDVISLFELSKGKNKS